MEIIIGVNLRRVERMGMENIFLMVVNIILKEFGKMIIKWKVL
jgi:hypothetical protein